MCGIYAVIACEDNPAPGLFGDVAGLLETSMDKRGRDSWDSPTVVAPRSFDPSKEKRRNFGMMG